MTTAISSTGVEVMHTDTHMSLQELFDKLADHVPDDEGFCITKRQWNELGRTLDGFKLKRDVHLVQDSLTSNVLVFNKAGIDAWCALKIAHTWIMVVAQTEPLQ